MGKVFSVVAVVWSLAWTILFQLYAASLLGPTPPLLPVAIGVVSLAALIAWGVAAIVSRSISLGQFLIVLLALGWLIGDCLWSFHSILYVA